MYDLCPCSATQPHSAGRLKQRSTSPTHAVGLWDLVTPIRPTFPGSCMEPKCAWLRREPSTELCGKHTVSASARSKRSVPLIELARLSVRYENFSQNTPMAVAAMAILATETETATAPAFATACVSSSVSINWTRSG